MKKYIAYCLLSVAFTFGLYAQNGNDFAYRFLSTSTSARATALGGTYNSIYDNDASLAYQNPATLNPKLHKYMSLSYIPYFAGISFGNFNYIHQIKKIATFQFGATYLNYGKLPTYDEYGEQTGLMIANDIALNVGAGRSYKDKYKFGVNAKLITSQLGGYSSVGMAFDLAAMYVDSARNICIALNVQNLGFQMKSYTKGKQEVLPVDVQLSFSHRLRFVPFRFIITAHHLYQWDVRYENPAVIQQQNSGTFGSNQNTKETSTAVKVIDNIARHLIIGGEIYIGKIITLNFAYNHMRRAELAIPSYGGLAGFSVGATVKINRFTLEYGLAKYALPGSVNHITLNVNLGKHIKINRTKKAKK